MDGAFGDEDVPLTVGDLSRELRHYRAAVGGGSALTVSVDYETGMDGRDYVLVGTSGPSHLADLSNCVEVREQTPMTLEPWELGELDGPWPGVQARYLHRMLVPRDEADAPPVEAPPPRRGRWRRLLGG